VHNVINAPEQLPVLCRRCGGAARMLDVQHLECQYCGQRDQLPTDAILRNIDLRARIDGARAMLAQLDGLSLAMARMYEGSGGLLRVGVPLVALFGTMLASNLYSAFQTNNTAPEALRTCLVVNMAASSAMLWVLPLGIFAGLLIARFRYRKHVRPWLLARAPLVEGAPARCRVCGAPIETLTNAVWCTCRHCQTQNLLVGEVFQHRAQRLVQEQQFHHQRVVGASTASSQLGVKLDRIFYISMGVGWALTLVLSSLVQRWICGWQ
jgi:hypothetical protein